MRQTKTWWPQTIVHRWPQDPATELTSLAQSDNIVCLWLNYIYILVNRSSWYLRAGWHIYGKRETGWTIVCSKHLFFASTTMNECLTSQLWSDVQGMHFRHKYLKWKCLTLDSQSVFLVWGLRMLEIGDIRESLVSLGTIIVPGERMLDILGERKESTTQQRCIACRVRDQLVWIWQTILRRHRGLAASCVTS